MPLSTSRSPSRASPTKISRPSPACDVWVMRMTTGAYALPLSAEPLVPGSARASSRDWAIAASVRAMPAVAWMKDVRSWEAASSVSGTTAPTSTAAEHGPDRGQQLLQPERLDQVVVGALVQGQHAVGFLAPRRHDDDGRVAGLAETPADLHAVHVGQAEIEQENVGDRPVERRLAGRDATGFVAGPGQAADQLSGDTRVVFHHEDPAETRVHGLHVKHETRRHPTRRRS